MSNTPVGQRPLRVVRDEHKERHEHGKHAGSPNRVEHLLSLILDVVTADMVINIGVLATSTVVMFVELGIVKHPEPSEPTPVKVVKVVPSPEAHD
jgi:hypothetical protein